jgi:hypothetical protein
MSNPADTPRPNYVLLVGILSVIAALVAVVISDRFSPFAKTSDRREQAAGNSPAANAAANKPGALGTASELGSVENWGEAQWRQRLAEARLSDYPALMKYAVQIKDEQVRARVLGALAAKWINQDLRNFIAFLDETEVDDKDSRALWQALMPAFEQAFPLLNDEAAAMSELTDVAGRMVAYAATVDPEEAVAWSRRWLQGDMLASALAASAVEWAKKSPQSAFDVLATIDAPARRVDAITGIGAVLGATNAAQALKWVNSLQNPAERPYAIGPVLTAMSASQPERAAQEFELFRSKLATDYAAQLQETRLTTGRDPSKETEAGSNGGEANASESDLPSVSPQLHLLNDAGVAIAAHWAASDPAKAMQWVDALPPSRMKLDAIQSALGSWAKVNPAEAFAAYEHQYASIDQSPAEDIFRAWAEQRPAEAAARAVAIENEDQRSYAIAGAVSGWLKDASNSAAAEAWADQLPAGKSRDLANAGIVDAVNDVSPAIAWKRAGLIEAPDVRKEAMNSAFISLVGSNPGMARAALKSTNLSNEEATSLQSILDTVVAATTN